MYTVQYSACYILKDLVSRSNKPDMKFPYAKLNNRISIIIEKGHMLQI